MTPQALLIIASDSDLPSHERSWGHGGWSEPETRESLDWLTLARALGWETRVTHVKADELHPAIRERRRCVVLSADPASLTSEDVALITSNLAESPSLLVMRSAQNSPPIEQFQGVTAHPDCVEGRELVWKGPGPARRWQSREPVRATKLEPAPGTEVWATLDGSPVITARSLGTSSIATLGFHPSAERDRNSCVSALLKQLLVFGSPGPVAWFDWSNTMVLRMDDPGGAQNVFKRTWCYPKIPETEWARVGEELRKRNARLSVGYISGWVDDGDALRGELHVHGQLVERVGGKIYPSPEIRYLDLAGHTPGTVHDYESEFRGLRRLQESGLVSLELHGFTHMHPDLDSWLRADDRYESKRWFRELGKDAQHFLSQLSPSERPLGKGIDILRRYFECKPTTLICPGEEFTGTALSWALDSGLQLVGSYYLAMRIEDRFCWSQHICSPYLDVPESKWFDSELPVIGYFHDQEVSVQGVSWMTRWLDAWQSAGAARFIDYRHLASSLTKNLSVQQVNGALTLTIHDVTPLPISTPSPLEIHIADPSGLLPASVTVITDNDTYEAPLEPADPQRGIVRVAI